MLIRNKSFCRRARAGTAHQPALPTIHFGHVTSRTPVSGSGRTAKEEGSSTGAMTGGPLAVIFTSHSFNLFKSDRPEMNGTQETLASSKANYLTECYSQRNLCYRLSRLKQAAFSCRNA